MEVDKILLTAFLTALAGFITAALSIVKLVNEKESKTTEYRQAWTDSVRESLSVLIGKITALASMASVGSATYKHFLKLIQEGESESERVEAVRKDAINVSKNAWLEATKDYKTLHGEIYQAYAKVRLHFKPDDTSFSRIEHKFEYCMDLIAEIHRCKNDSKRAKLKEKIYSAANEITGYSRNILKQEWETVKLGEPAYKHTKRWSIRICVIMLFILLTIGVHAIISSGSGKVAEGSGIPFKYYERHALPFKKD